MPSRTDISVRDARVGDYPAVARIQTACPEAAQWPVGDYEGFNILIALIGDIPAGFCAWRQSSSDEAELLNLAVAPANRRAGVASRLLDALCARADGDIFLEVAEPNGAAIALYEHHGWVKTGMRRGYYEGGTINGIVMRRRA